MQLQAFGDAMMSRIRQSAVPDALSGVAAFVQAAEAGSFALAAQRLGLSRSAVAKAIARLEQRLGVRLFHRTTRSQSLTDEGQGYFEHCRRALDALAQAENGLSAGQGEASGRLRVTAPLLLGRRWIAPALAPLLATHPRLELELHFSDRVVDLVGESFDLAIRVGVLPDSSALSARQLGTQRFAYYAAPLHVQRHGRPETATDYAGHPAIVYAASGSFEPWRLGEETLDIRPRLWLDDVQAIADAAIAGHGLARLPTWLAAAWVASGQLLPLAAAPPSLHATVHAVWPHARHLPLRTRLAVDTLQLVLERALAERF